MADEVDDSMAHPEGGRPVAQWDRGVERVRRTIHHEHRMTSKENPLNLHTVELAPSSDLPPSAALGLHRVNSSLVMARHSRPPLCTLPVLFSA